MHTLRIGVVADYSPAVTAHRAIPVALKLAAAEMGCAIDLRWLLTTDVSHKSDCHGIWCAPGSPYASTEGALEAIGFARANNVPFLGTCGGFQHALIEYARNHLDVPQADHQESNPSAPELVITHLACSLRETPGLIQIKAGSKLAGIYGSTEIIETYNCSFGLNPRYQQLFERGGIEFTGRDAEGSVRAFELPAHRFFLATLFQPERSALAGRKHPLITEFLRQAAI